MWSPSPKLSVPQSSVQISGSSSSTCTSRVNPPTRSVPWPKRNGSSPAPISRSPPMPAVRLMMTSVSAQRMRSTTSRYRFGSRLPRPVCGSRTWQCATVAPALAASIAAAAISLGVTGIAGCLPTVSPAPVTAQVTMTSWFMLMALLCLHGCPVTDLRSSRTELRFRGRQPILAIEGLHVRKPRIEHLGILLQIRTRSLSRPGFVHHRLHQLVLQLRREAQLRDQFAGVGAALKKIGRGQRIDARLAVVGAERRIAARQVIDAELDIHRMRLPTPQHHPLLVANRTLERDQHPGLAGLDQLEATKPVQVLVDHLLYLRVGTAARLDPVDLAVELLAVPGDIVERLQAGGPSVAWHRKRRLGAGQVGRFDHVDRLAVEERLNLQLLQRPPVAQRYIELLVLQAGKRDGHRRHRRAWLVAERLEDHRSQRGHRRDVGPAVVGKTQIAATRRLRLGK